MIDPNVGFDERDDARLVEYIKLVDPTPCRQRDLPIQAGVRREDDVIVALRYRGELFDQFGAILTGVLNDHAAIFEIVYLHLPGNRFGVHTPSSQSWSMGP